MAVSEVFLILGSCFAVLLFSIAFTAALMVGRK